LNVPSGKLDFQNIEKRVAIGNRSGVALHESHRNSNGGAECIGDQQGSLGSRGYPWSVF
jgi:hypothetical protein